MRETNFSKVTRKRFFETFHRVKNDGETVENFLQRNFIDSISGVHTFYGKTFIKIGDKVYKISEIESVYWRYRPYFLGENND